MSLTGKTAVITGGTRGIGYAIASRFAEEGADLALIATRGGDAAEAAVEVLRNLGVTVRLYLCDVKDAEAVNQTAESILADFGGVDVLVNNAGITRDNLLPGLSASDIDDVIDVNLKGTMFMTRALIRPMVKKRRGAIINISSVVGMMGNRGQTNYAASKAGIIGFTKSVAKEYGSRNIRCNAIAPGFIATEMTAALGEEATAEMLRQLPIGRAGKPEDVAEAALFLAGDTASYITGEVLRVDGGMYI